MSDKVSQMDSPQDQEREADSDIQTRLEGLELDDKSYDEVDVVKRVDTSEPSPVKELPGYFPQHATNMK
jgi:hypothetical protein